MLFPFKKQDLVTGVHPIDYEKELEDKRTEIKRDRHNDLLLFPDDDISVSNLKFLLLQ